MTKQTGVLVELELAQAIVKFLEDQPFKEVNNLLLGLSKCQTMTVNIEEGEKEGKSNETAT